MKKRIIALFLLLIMVFSCAGASAVTYYSMKDRASIRQLPNYSSRVLDTYRADWALTIDSVANQKWALITYSNGISGYIERAHLVIGKSYTGWIRKDKTALRKGPDYNFKTIVNLAQGEKVKVLTNGKSYCYVKTSTSYGYVPASAISRKKISASKDELPSGKNYTAYVVSKNGGKVALRSHPSGLNKYNIKKVKYGTKITVLKKYNTTYSYVDVNGTKGYMASKNITKYKPAPLPTKQTPAPFVPYTTYAIKDNKGNTPRLYRGEGLGYSSKKLTVGTTVKVIAKGKDRYWVKVKVGGKTGYMPLKFLY